MPELDSLRGIAILLVLCFHGFNYPGLVWSQFKGPARVFITASFGGWTGVYLFFVLSGFLITGILLDSKPKPHYYRRFYIRRALRILPAFYLILLLLIGYGLYLVHMLAFDFIDHWIVRYFPGLYAQLPSSLSLLFTRFLISMGLAVGVAFLSRRYFEERFLGLKDRWTPPDSNPSGQPATMLVDRNQCGEPLRRERGHTDSP